MATKDGKSLFSNMYNKMSYIAPQLQTIFFLVNELQTFFLVSKAGKNS